MSGPIFTIGQGRQCSLWLRDASISKSLCNLRPTELQRGGSPGTLLVVTGGKGIVQVNGKVYPKNSTIPLNGGDELVFSSYGRHAYIFQQLFNDDLAAAGMPPSLSMLEAHGAPIKGLHFETRSGEASAVTGASILASLSSFRKDLSILPPPSQNDDDAQQGSEMKDNSNRNDVNGVSSSEKAVPSSGAAEDPNLNTIGFDTSGDADIGKVPGETHESRPLLRILAGSSGSEVDLSDSLSKFLYEQREIRELLKDFDTPILASSRRQAYKDRLHQGILTADNIEVSLESFPYYLSETTKNVLIASTYIHLKLNTFAKYTAYLPTVIPRVLLSGPAGSEIYQETLTKALAKHFGARFLMVDSLLLPGVRPSCSGSVKDFDSAKESSRPDRASVFAKRAGLAVSIQLRKRASSVEADITGGSTISSQAQPKLETSTASSKNYTFKKGSVTFVEPWACPHTHVSWGDSPDVVLRNGQRVTP
ncbi:hypothetical protein U1Q18_034295 [Sarracenia purpurea var. burkii]